MRDLKGTKTEKNILTAFAGESQARNRYTYFASQAKKEGFEQIAGIFLETADNEKEHAERLFKFLKGGSVEIKASYPAGLIASTADNLKAAAEGEHYEQTIIYPQFAEIAEQEGFSDIAKVMLSIAVAERQHEKRYLAFLDNLKTGRVFKREKTTKWKCRNCGYIHEGTEPPEKCPACDHPQAYYELLAENY
ncbi:MAG: rubrerythrin [Candidatus Aminicenantales bacterium]